MMPYLAKSLSSMSPKASHGHTTVMSVPRPSMPGMSSPKLQTRGTIDIWFSGGGSRLLRCVSKKQITELDVQTTRHLTEAARNVSMLALLFIHCIFLLVCFCCLPLLAWFGRLALERASLPLLEFGWALLGCSGAGGSTRGQGASCRWAGVHCSLKTTTKNPKHFFLKLKRSQPVFVASPSLPDSL